MLLLTPLNNPTKKVSADSSAPGTELSACRLRKQGLRFSMNAALSLHAVTKFRQQLAPEARDLLRFRIDSA
jgi:hypothetical protein